MTSYLYLRKEPKLNRMRSCGRRRPGSVNLGQRVMGVVAVIGGGIRGLVSAYVVAKGGVDVVVYEKEEQLGGHAITVNFDATELDHRLLFLNPRRPRYLSNYATTGRIVAIVRASPRLSSSLTSINFLTPNHSRRDGNGSTHMWRLSNISNVYMWSSKYKNVAPVFLAATYKFRTS
ncbi:hypothetical protein V6Z12_A10G183900 [Gossypium hirsutum]